MPLRDRAHIVCTQCHSRKVKCDLQTSVDGVCQNCRHSGQPCIQRSGVRKRRKLTRPLEKSSLRPQTRQGLEGDLPSSVTSDPLTSTVPPDSGGSRARSLSPQDNRFVSHCSVIRLAGHAEVPTSGSVGSGSLRDAVLKTTQAAVLPRPALLQARTDAYMAHIFHHCPVVDPSEVSGTGLSVLLQQGLYMAGDHIRHSSTGPKESRAQYQKLKLLLSIDYEQDCVQILKTLCLMSCWSVEPSNPVSLDGPWKWTGLAIQLAIQMGLHKEHTYARRANAGCLRRIFWWLYNNDALQVACWGRPPLLRLTDFDVRLPKVEDFEVPNTQALVFLETTKLCTITTRISRLYREKQLIQPAELSSIDAALTEWVRNVPGELRLYDMNGRRTAYWRPALEIHIQYFVAIVMSQMLRHDERDRPWRTSLPSRIAASCATVLYDEIDCRDEIVFLLPNHGFFCLAISLPLICHRPQSEPERTARTRDIAIVRSVLNRMRDRYGDASMVLAKMETLQNTVEKHPRFDDDSRDTVLADPQNTHGHAKDLFPFPADLCSDIDLLERVAVPDQESGMDEFLVQLQGLRDEQAEPPFFASAYGFLDFFEQDLGLLNFLQDNDDPFSYSAQTGFS